MASTFKLEVYTTPTHIQGTGGRPNTPTELWLHPHEFHSYIPALSAEEIRNLDEVLAYGAPVHSVTEDLERLFLTPSKRRVDPSIPEEAFAARKNCNKPESPLRPPPPDNRVQHLAVPQMNPYDESYTIFRRRASQIPISTIRSYKGPVRAPLAESPSHEFAVWSRRSPAEVLTHSQTTLPTSLVHRQHPRAAALDVQRTPPARSSNLGRQRSLVTPPAQSTQARVPVTPSTTNSSQSSYSVCSSCGSRYTSVPSSSSSQGSTSSRLRAELDRNVHKMEGLAAKGRSLRDIIPSMAAPSGVPKAWKQKTEVEKWLEKEMAIQEQGDGYLGAKRT
ncbi:hypothetical protein BGX38DRAFT_897878 [Terfezia claveryi]|nr:hypothetical protein BGX38DRAFT_897878 [Terfezia claveryi]